ncbi:MAG: hypothetical protein J5861_00385 [Desulfovibrio sp.]|nr:hypothetical protein [Desulfovibrio sp.]
MSRTLCLLHANCQGDMLLPLLEDTPTFARLFRVRHLVNYTHEDIDLDEMAHCSLFLYQYLSPKWKEHSSEQMLNRLSPSCTAIAIPNLFFKGYWPFWKSGGPINFADSLLEKLLEMGTPQTALRLYLKGNPALIGDTSALEGIVEDSLRHEEDKETRSHICCSSLIREQWRERQLFLTINHPGTELLFHVADSLLRLLGLGAVPPSVRSAYSHPFDDFWLPIHPAVGQALNLPFTAPQRRYTIFQNRLTHQEYVLAYLACRSNNVHDFLTFLKNFVPSDTPKLTNRMPCNKAGVKGKTS